MTNRLRWQLRLALVAAFGAFCTVGFLAYSSTATLIRAEADTIATQAALNDLEHVQTALVDAETGERGFVITGDTSFLEPYNDAAPVIGDQIARLRQTDISRQKLDELNQLAELELQALERVIDTRRYHGPASANAMVARGAAKRLMNEIRDVISEIAQSETIELGRRNARCAAVATKALWAMTLLIGVAGAVGFLGYHLAMRNATQQDYWTRQVEKTAEDVRFVRDFVETLHVCFSLPEAYEVIAGFCGKLLPGVAGELAIINDSRNLVEVKHRWNSGDALDPHAFYAPEQCHGLRCGKIYHHRAGSLKLSCGHVSDAKVKHYLCIPLSAHGEGIGVLHLDFPDDMQEISSSQLQLLANLAQHAAMAIANLKLWEKLESQSIRDPLTGLFNRRYMEASLQREFVRAERRGVSIGVVMIDLDHFKALNDTFGHEAGDRVLQEIASVLVGAFRSEDIVCRYGGEELLVIVPEVTRESLLERLEKVAERIRGIRVTNRNQAISRVTASFGVAIFPDNATSDADLIAKADYALYCAKQSGRDRVVAYGPEMMLAHSGEALSGDAGKNG